MNKIKKFQESYDDEKQFVEKCNVFINILGDMSKKLDNFFIIKIASLQCNVVSVCNLAVFV